MRTPIDLSSWTRPDRMLWRPPRDVRADPTSRIDERGLEHACALLATRHHLCPCARVARRADPGGRRRSGTGPCASGVHAHQRHDRCRRKRPRGTHAAQFPIGLAFHGGDLYVTENDVGNAGITRLRDLDENGVFEERVAFVTGIPRGNHHVNQLQIEGDMLVTSIGMASNGGHPDCENVYTGTIAWIRDVTLSDFSGANNLATRAMSSSRSTVPRSSRSQAAET
jgi:hypothetical protein